MIFDDDAPRTGQTPSGAELLDIARDTLRDDISPHLGADSREVLALIDRGMAAVQRDLESADEGSPPADTSPARAALEQARSALRALAESQPPADAHHSVLMVERATAIAQRELDMLASVEVGIAGALEHYRALYGDEAVAEAGADDRARVIAMEQRLTRDIRDGTLDGACGHAVRSLLYVRTHARLSSTNPDYLAKSAQS